MKTTEFYQTALYKVVQRMKASGNAPGLVRQWREMSIIWALDHSGPDAEAIRAWMPLWKVRPFYTATELAPIMPVLAVAFGFAQKAAPQMSPNRLANLLDFAGLPFLHGDELEMEFRSPVTGLLDRYFIVERIHFWRDRATTQEEFEAEFET